MGTTKDALNAGSVSYRFVVAIEGYNYLLTNATASEATTAWSGTGYTQALTGLFVDLKTGQSIQPWKAFSTSKTLQFHVRDQDGNDTFGIDTHKRNAGAETELAATCDRDDTTITVVNTDNFPASGDAFIGTECFSYTGITTTTFTGCTRGKFAPFPTSGTTFAQFHRVVAPSGVSPKLRPIVSANPRVWLGKWCGVWIHRYVGGVLDTKAEAHLAFAGRIADIADGANLATAVTVQHVLDVINETTIFRDGWSASVKPGIRLDLWQAFSLSETDGTTVKTTNPLQVVAGAPASVNEIQEGLYTHDQLYDAINQWLASEKDATRLHSEFWMWEAPTSQYPTPHVKIYWDRSASGAVDPQFYFAFPDEVLRAFGFTADDTTNGSSFVIRSRTGSTRPQHVVAQNPPVHSVFTQTQANTIQLEVTEERGEFIDQYDFFPASEAVTPDLGLEWGFFLLDSQFLIFGAKVGAELQYCLQPKFRWAGAETTRLLDYAIPEGRTSVEVRQILILEDNLSNLLKYFFYSTGTPTYNHATWDEFDGFGLGLGVPSPLLGSNFLQSIDTLPGAQASQLVVIDRPKKFVDVWNGDLVFRRAFLRWKDGGLQFRTWITPTAGAAIATLTEDNKAAPVGDQDNHRATTLETDEWQYPIIKLRYNRDVKDLSNADGFRSTLTLQDSVAIDDAGGMGKTLTISASNTYDDESGSGTLRVLLADFLASFPLHSRPAHTTARTIGPRHFEQLAVGDIVTLTDEYARDPDTGRRAVQARPAFITKTDVDYGGTSPDANEPRVAGGEVHLFMLPANRAATYVPSADIDDTASAGGFSAGYNNGTSTIRCYANRYSIASEPADAASVGVAGYKIRIVEKDPTNPASPTVWERTVLSQSGNDIVMTSTLSAPAWDPTKKYRVMWDSYSDNAAAQQVHCFQANDDNGMIESAGAPREYSVGQGNAPTGTSSAALTDEVELPPENSYGDGEPRDVGTDLVLARLLNNLIDVKTANHSPQLTAVMSGSGGTWNLVSVEPHYVGLEQFGIFVRTATVAAWMRSTNGASASVRVSLCRDMPSDDSDADVNRGLVYSEVTFSQTSTTWATSSDGDLSLAVKSETGFVFILIEVSSNAETRGLAKFVEGEREGFAVIGV